jgi:hypothetical protein
MNDLRSTRNLQLMKIVLGAGNDVSWKSVSAMISILDRI